MIHYTCDKCGRPIRPDELRYVVEMEVFPISEPTDDAHLDADTDQLEDLNDMIEQSQLNGTEMLEDHTRQLRLDLCPECQKKFVKSPLGRGETLAQHLGFSSN